MARFIEGHMSWTSVMLTLARLGDRGSCSIVVSTASSWVCLRLWVCIRDAQQGGFFPVLSVRSAQKTAPPHGDALSQIPDR